MKPVVVGTAGHIDHGKSALVLALTGTDPDRLKEEKARGITIDLGFAHFHRGEINYAFVDVPGHERFVKNMLAGVGGIDLVLLIVAADEGVMPQTREHFAICRLLHVPAGIVVLTKIDLADRELIEVARHDVEQLVAGSFLEGAPLVPVSSRTGEGLDELQEALADAASAIRTRRSDGVTRLPIDRVFSVKGFGTVVTGTLVSGRVGVGEALDVAPAGHSVVVRGVQVHGTGRDEALAGERVAANLAGVDVADLARGDTLVTRGAFRPTRIVDAAIETLGDSRPLKHGARVRFHHGTAEILGRLAVIGPAPSTGDQEPLVLAPGSRGFVRLRLDRPAVVVRGDRYILRAYSPPETIAGGLIVDAQPPPSAIRTVAALDRCRRLEAGIGRMEGDLAAARLFVTEAGRGFPVSALVSRLGIAPAGVSLLVERLEASGDVRQIGAHLVAASVVDHLKRSLLERLTTFHRDHPLSDGAPREDVRTKVFAHGHPTVFNWVVDELVREGALAGHERLKLTGHRVELSAGDARAMQAIEDVVRGAGLRPPDLSAVAAAAGVSTPAAERLIGLLQRQKRLVKLDDLIFHDEALKGLKAAVAGLKDRNPRATIDVATFKKEFDVSRKFAIPLLEYLDRERVTRRMGDARQIL